ncbi:hypothetical protein NDU88_007810 [Pleurodeles waltl]|uniref:Uncharacterized protein n=1 Tax=Pleurodeles waltl TaxID=8319 RepID=A0AAV7QN52_PLEWA|nr:hypothetical protein NDU88_007810 [Pleurodeles waltl]
MVLPPTFDPRTRQGNTDRTSRAAPSHSFLLTGEDVLLGTPRCTGNKRNSDMGFLLTGEDVLLGTPRCTGSKRNSDMGESGSVFKIICFGNPDIQVPCEADGAAVARTSGRGVVRGGESGLRSRFCSYRSRNIRQPATV